MTSAKNTKRGRTMTRSRLSLIAAFAILMLGGAACGSTGGLGGATSTPTAVASCPLGKWRSTQVTADGTAVGVAVTAQGGEGVKMTVGDDGAVHAIFSGMQPIGFTAQVAGSQVKGEIRYGGDLDGKVELSSSGSATGNMTASPTTDPNPPGTG